MILIEKITLVEQNPPSPDPGFIIFYIKSDGLLYAKDSNGNEKQVKFYA